MENKKVSDDTPNLTEYYDKRRKWTEKERAESPSIRIRTFNNCVKSMLISGHCRRGDTVFDMCGGRGGDLRKMHYAGISRLVLVDASSDSVEEAERRYREGTKRKRGAFRFDAEFYTSDCFSRAALEPLLARTKLTFDVVSCQFALQYAFQDENSLNAALSMVSKFLRPGGVFIGTMPNAEYICGKWQESQGEKVSTSPFQLHFKEKFSKTSPFGKFYSFSLLDALERVPEPLAPFEVLREYAARHGLLLERWQTMRDFFIREQGSNADLVRRMHVLNKRQQVYPTAWETAQLYGVFVFRKKGITSAKTGNG